MKTVQEWTLVCSQIPAWNSSNGLKSLQALWSGCTGLLQGEELKLVRTRPLYALTLRLMVSWFTHSSSAGVTGSHTLLVLVSFSSGQPPRIQVLKTCVPVDALFSRGDVDVDDLELLSLLLIGVRCKVLYLSVVVWLTCFFSEQSVKFSLRLCFASALFVLH